MSSHRNLPFSNVAPKDTAAVAVMDESSAFVGFNRAAAEAVFGRSWDMMAAVYQMAFHQALASVLPRRSVLDLCPSVN